MCDCCEDLTGFVVGRPSDRGRQSCFRGVDVHVEAVNNRQNKLMKVINVILEPTIRISGSGA
jgi:hypothetical protein